MTIIGGWAALIALHGIAEVRLIAWLATPERDKDPALARYVLVVSHTGFLFVVAVALLIMLFRSLEKDILGAALRLERDEPQEQAQAGQSPLSRSRVRPLYPAHRAIRRPSRRARSTPGR